MFALQIVRCFLVEIQCVFGMPDIGCDVGCASHHQDDVTFLGYRGSGETGNWACRDVGRNW